MAEVIIEGNVTGKTRFNLEDTIAMMISKNYKDRFKAEYYQTKERYERLKAFNNKIEAANETRFTPNYTGDVKHDCPDAMLREQQAVMGQYLHILEVRAVIEGIEL